MDYKTLLTGKTARFIAGGITATLGMVLMYPDTFGIHLETTMVLAGVPIDVLGGVVFALGIFLVANGMKAE